MRTRHGLDRLLMLADAVVAIAITLLVLPLADIAVPTGRFSVGRLLSDHAGQLGAFVLSFVVIASLWRAHHRIFEQIAAYDTVLVRLTFLWLFTVVFLPFPTELLGGRSSGGTDSLYIGTLLVSSLALGATSAWVDAHPALQAEGAHDRAERRRRWTLPLLFAVSLALAGFVPRVGMWALLSLLLAGPIDALARHRERQKSLRPRADHAPNVEA